MNTMVQVLVCKTMGTREFNPLLPVSLFVCFSATKSLSRGTGRVYFAVIIFSLARLRHIKRNVHCDEPISVLFLAPAGVFIC